MEKADFADSIVFKADFADLFFRFLKRYSISHMDMADFADFADFAIPE